MGLGGTGEDPKPQTMTSSMTSPMTSHVEVSRPSFIPLQDALNRPKLVQTGPHWSVLVLTGAPWGAGRGWAGPRGSAPCRGRRPAIGSGPGRGAVGGAKSMWAWPQGGGVATRGAGLRGGHVTAHRQGLVLAAPPLLPPPQGGGASVWGRGQKEGAGSGRAGHAPHVLATPPTWG